jgi:hypothetical protein
LHSDYGSYLVALVEGKHIQADPSQEAQEPKAAQDEEKCVYDRFCTYDGEFPSDEQALEYDGYLLTGR